MKLIESLRGIENSFTNVKKVSKKEIAKTELSESLFKAANQIDKRNYRTAFDLTNGYQKALEEAIEKINPDKRWFEVTNCDIRTTLLENHNNIEATIRRILNESEDDAIDIDDEEAIQRVLDSNKKKEDYIFVDASGSTTKNKMIRATKEGLKKLPNAKVLYVSDFGIDEKLPQHGHGWCNPEIIGRYLSGKPINKAIFFTDEDYDSSRYDLGKIGIEVNTDLMSYNESLTEEAIGSDLSEYQKWVDYDMEHYGKISGNTFRKITEAGLSLVKDQYGDYEVIANKKDESLKENSKNTLTIKVSDIDYDISEEDLFGDETVEEIKASIPTEFTFNIRRDDWENFDHDELLADCIGDETGWLVNNFNYEILDESICEDTVKQGSHWVNKGEEGTHGKFKTKREADAQRRAMFASGYKAEALKESQHPDLSEKNHTLAHALKRTWNDWANAKTREEAVNILVKAIKDEGLDTPATKKFLAHIKNQPLNAIIKTATNYTMAGMGDQYKVFNPSKKKGESLTEDDKDEEAYKKLKAGYSLADALK